MTDFQADIHANGIILRYSCGPATDADLEEAIAEVQADAERMKQHE